MICVAGATGYIGGKLASALLGAGEDDREHAQDPGNARENDERNAEIISAAIRVFQRDGFRGATLDDVAKEVGISKSLIYYHFKNKFEILAQMYRNMGELFFEVLNPILEDESLDRVARLRLVIKAHVSIAIQNKSIFEIYFRERQDIPPAVQDKLVTHRDRIYVADTNAVRIFDRATGAARGLPARAADGPPPRTVDAPSAPGETRPMSRLYHAGSRELQDRFDTRRLADRLDERLGHGAFSDHDKAFIASRALFFLASADAAGRPDFSYKGGDPGFVRVTGSDELEFPSYDGNGQFRSLGNVLANPAVGLLFIDFESPRRLRVNGVATLLDEARIDAVDADGHDRRDGRDGRSETSRDPQEGRRRGAWQ